MAELADELRIDSANAMQTEAVGRAIGAGCGAGDVIALDGELGAGKTQFVRGLAEGLGLDPRQVSSPTFVIVQEYAKAAAPGRGIGGSSPTTGPASPAADGVGGLVEVLIHIDAYRLRSAEDRASIGWEGDGSAMREGAVVAIEWAALMGDALPDDRLAVRIEHEPDGRGISVIAHGDWRPRMAQVRTALADVANG